MARRLVRISVEHLVRWLAKQLVMLLAVWRAKRLKAAKRLVAI